MSGWSRWGSPGTKRTTRRAVAAAKAAYVAGHRRGYRPWIPSRGCGRSSTGAPGRWCFGPDGRPRPTLLFCAWRWPGRGSGGAADLGPQDDTLLTCLDATLRRLGGAPAFALTDNEKTVTVEHVAGIAVRHPLMVAAGRHYGLTVHTCVPFDPSPRAARRPLSGSRKRTWCPPARTCAPATTPLPSWSRRCGRSASRSTPGCTGRPTGPGRGIAGWSRVGCIRSRRTVHRGTGRDQNGQYRSDGPVRVGASPLHPD